MSESALTIAQLEQQEVDLVLPAFDEEVAWRLGSGLRDRASAAGHGVTLDISTPLASLFRAALPGSTPDQQHWVRRKEATVFRFGTSSALVRARVAQVSPDAESLPWIDVQDYAITGGAVPVRVRGAGVVAAIAVSGLASGEDHDLAVDALGRELARG